MANSTVEQARRDANNGKSGSAPSGMSNTQRQEYQRAFADQKAKNGKK